MYLKDRHRSLMPGSHLVFSFLELEDPRHAGLFTERAAGFERQDVIPLLDTFLHRDWITTWAKQIGCGQPSYTRVRDSRNHSSFATDRRFTKESKTRELLCEPWDRFQAMKKPPAETGGGTVPRKGARG